MMNNIAQVPPESRLSSPVAGSSGKINATTGAEARQLDDGCSFKLLKSWRTGCGHSVRVH